MTGVIRSMPMVLAGVALLAGYVAPAQAQSAEASGEVRRVDAAAGKVTIKHGAIAGLDLPAMTLVYRADPKLLAGLKAGDKVDFTAARQNGKYVVTAIENK